MPIFTRPDADAPTLEIQKDWRAPTHLAESISRVGEFLRRHTPAS